MPSWRARRRRRASRPRGDGAARGDAGGGEPVRRARCWACTGRSGLTNAVFLPPGAVHIRFRCGAVYGKMEAIVR
jgi:hypothetical protein